MDMSILSRKFPLACCFGVKADACRLGPAISLKHGYESFETYMDEAVGKFSLLETGILKKPSTRLLFVNVSCVNTILV